MSTQRTAVVTGAKGGFGRLTAEAFAAEGWRVYATMRDVDGRNAKAAAELRATGVLPLELDVTSEASDPKEVARAILHLANAPAGTRPLRTTVPVNPLVDEVNAAVAQIQRKVIENLGLAALLSNTPA